MDIINYTSYFHDGGIINIEQKNNNISISMESAEMDPDDLKENVLLSKYNTIKGKLCIEGIVSIMINEKPFNRKLIMTHDDGEILDFEFLNNHIIKLGIQWNNFPPKPIDLDFSIIRIEAEKIWWENIPDLYDPFD